MAPRFFHKLLVTVLVVAAIVRDAHGAGYHHASLDAALGQLLGANSTATATAPPPGPGAPFFFNLFETPSSYAGDYISLPLMATPVCAAYHDYDSNPMSLSMSVAELGAVLTGSAPSTPLGTTAAGVPVYAGNFTVVLALTSATRIPVLAALKNHKVAPFSSTDAFPANVLNATHVRWVADDAAVAAAVRRTAMALGFLPLQTFGVDPTNMACMPFKVTNPKSGATEVVEAELDPSQSSFLSVAYPSSTAGITAEVASTLYPLIGALIIHVNANTSCSTPQDNEGVRAAAWFLREQPLTPRMGFIRMAPGRVNRILTVLVDRTCPGGDVPHVQSTGSSILTAAIALWANAYWRTNNFFFGFWCGGSHKAVAAIQANDYRLVPTASLFTPAERAAYPTVRFVPAIATAVAIAFNLPGVSHLAVPRCIVPSIFNGTVRYWDEPVIARANPTLKLPHRPIGVATRSTRSGTTEMFLAGIARLEAACNNGRTFTPVTHTWNASMYSTMNSTSSSGVVKFIRRVPYTIGFLTVVKSRSSNFNELTLLHESLGTEAHPSAASVRRTLAASTLVPATGEVRLRISDGYPFVGITYWMYRQHSSGTCAEMKHAVDFARWSLTHREAFALADNANYVSLTQPLRDYSWSVMDDATCDGAALYPKPESRFPVLYIVLIAVLCVLAVACPAALVYRRFALVAAAPKDAAKPFAAVFIGPRNLAQVWERSPSGVPAALAMVTEVVQREARRHGCYTVKRVGDFHLVVARDSADAIRFAEAAIRDMDARAFASGGGATGAGERATVKSDGKVRNGGSMRSASHARSDTASHLSAVSSRSQSVRSSRRTDALADFKLCLRAGIHFGTAHVEYDSERHAYDYSGPLINTAAAVADLGKQNQVVLTDAVFAAVEEGDATMSTAPVALGAHAVGGNDKTSLFATFPCGAPSDAYEGNDECVDSALSALEQATAGLTRRRVAVLVLHVQGLIDDRERLSSQAFVWAYQHALEAIDDVVAAHRGHVHSFIDGTLIVSFNAVRTCASQSTRAAQCAIVLRAELADMKLRGVTSGISSGFAAVGTIDDAAVLVSDVSREASELQRVCGAYPGVSCLAPGSLATDMATLVYYQTVDLVVLPGRTAPSCLIAPIELRDSDGAACDEWLYMLQGAEGRDVFAALNAAFVAFATTGDTQLATALLAKADTAAADAADAATPRRADAASLQRLRAAIACATAADYGVSRSTELFGCVASS